ncbi:heat shock factor protein 1 isoform X1 [Paramormyrops kingsleyae]|uniref:heat shock factor protein 1 isoform X1 n=1 Tax=Paramormyrops kingsleyae TaxID=1676925 RepID=UPI003B97C536
MKQNCNVPAFLSKLWTLVEDHSTSDLICWSQDGCSFIVCEEQRFCKEILPLYFKHSNMTSFVRQLNMYGFRKVLQVEAGLLRAEGRGGGGVEFQHPYFRRTQPHLLELIRRKVSVSRAGEEGVSPVSRVLLDLGQVRGWQDGSDCKLMALCRENESLGHELDTLRQKYQHHHRIIRKMIGFIANTVQSNGIAGLKRKLPLLIDTSGISHSPPKYSRTLSVQDTAGASPLQGVSLDFAGGSLYPNGMIISDVTELLELQGGAWEDGRSLSEGTFEPVLSPPSTPTAELDLSLLEPSETGESATDHQQGGSQSRSETCDPLTLIDTGLAALNPALNPPLTPSPGSSLDLLTELFNPQPCSPGGDSQTETLKGRSGMGDWARKRTASQTVATFDWGSQRRGQSEDEEGEEGSDILPCLLRLAQEASDFAYSPVGACPEMVQFDLNCLQEQ